MYRSLSYPEIGTQYDHCSHFGTNVLILYFPCTTMTFDTEVINLRTCNYPDISLTIEIILFGKFCHFLLECTKEKLVHFAGKQIKYVLKRK